MGRGTRAVVGLLVVVGLAGCATAAPLSSSSPSSSPQSGPRSSAAPAPSADPSASAVRAPMAWPATCDELVGPALAAELEERELEEGPTDDTIQGRFTGIGNGERWAEAMSCAYSAVDGRDDRFEFGVEQLSAADRDALLDLLRSGPGENTSGLTETRRGDAVLFTQTGAAASDSVPGDWAIAFAVYADAWTMVWSPAGGKDVLDQHLAWSASLEEQLYPGT